MKQKYKKQNCPRVQTAITTVMTSNVGCWYQDARYIGMWIMSLAFGADKYDVLNKLVNPDIHTKIVTYCRGDIRHRTQMSDIISFLILMELLLLWVSGFLDDVIVKVQ